jgi:hypothetical protein
VWTQLVAQPPGDAVTQPDRCDPEQQANIGDNLDQWQPSKVASSTSSLREQQTSWSVDKHERSDV